MTIREATGGMAPSPQDRMRDDELAIVPLVAFQAGEGFRELVIERTLRVYGDSLRRMAETEGEWWRSEVQDRLFAAGKTEWDVAEYARVNSPLLTELSDRAILSIYHAQQRHVWGANIIAGIAMALVRRGLHVWSERLPAICFLDMTGYTRLTAERGDTAAAALAEQVGRLVQRTSVAHGGRPVKWLGDGVMLFFPEPGPAVLAALGMVEGVAAAGLPPAHVGLHAGPVLFQEGDYYGQTVNVASRIGEYARPGRGAREPGGRRRGRRRGRSRRGHVPRDRPRRAQGRLRCRPSPPGDALEGVTTARRSGRRVVAPRDR